MDSICILHTLEVFRGFPSESGAILEISNFHFLRFLLSENRTQPSMMNCAVLGPGLGLEESGLNFRVCFFLKYNFIKFH